MDPILVPALSFIPEWMDRLLEDSEEEATANSHWRVKLLGKGARRFIWNLCVALGVKNYGVAGQACGVAEQYLATRIQEMSHLPNGSAAWLEFKRVLALRLPLTIALAIQLSAKMSCTAIQLRSRTIQAALLLRGATYSLEDIISSEFKMFKTLQFRIPLWTSVDAAELLATDVGMSAGMMPGITLIVNLAEFYRFKLEIEVRKAVAMPESYLRSRMRTLHIVAGAVAASARFLRFQGPDPVPRLATLTRAPCLYIACIADLVIQYLKQEENEPIMSRKRKLSSSD